MTYQSYWRDEPNTFEVEPYCLKAFKQRWYLVARSPYYDKIMIYSLDRVHQLEPTEETFAYPKDFNGEDYFEDCFGIIAAQDVNVETVKLKVSVLTNTAFSPSVCAPPSIFSRRFFRWVAMWRCWLQIGSGRIQLKGLRPCGINIRRIRHEGLCSYRL